MFLGFVLAGATNLDRIVLGSANYGADPNTTADITMQNDEYISNATDGEVEISGTLNLSATVYGENVFTTTAETDTVTISGAAATDTYIITGEFTSAIDQQDILQWEAISGALVVHRMASGESALKYSWLRLK